MNPTKLLRADLARGQWVIDRQTDGLSHEDSLLQPPFRGNCLNWVLGHLAVHRGLMLEALGEANPVPQDLRQAYGPESSPILSASDAPYRLDQLVDLLRQLKEAFDQALEQRPAADLTAVIDAERGTTLGARLSFLLWHDAYHVGQTELLRQLAGKDDQVI